MLGHRFGHMPGAGKPSVEENLRSHKFYFSLSLSLFREDSFSLPPHKLCTLSPLSFTSLASFSSFSSASISSFSFSPPFLSKSLSLYSQNFNLIPLANQDLLRPIVRGQRGFSTHDQDALSLVVPVVVKVELAAFGRTLVQG